MDTRKLSSEYRMRRWAEIIKECNASGLSIKAYCESAGFHENTFFYWRKKLRETLISGMDNLETAAKGTTQTSYNETEAPRTYITERISRPPAGWVSVGTKNDNGTGMHRHARITIRRGGWTITAGTGCDTALLAETLKAVSQTCC